MKKRKSSVGDNTRSKIKTSTYKAELDKLKKQSEEKYSPKLGRQMKKIKKVIIKKSK